MIEDAITDTNREKATTILHPGIVQEFKVFVEGKIDHRIMKVMFPEITVQRVGLKKEVIERVKHQKNTIGVVDTDSDFHHMDIIHSERCVDTGAFCCIFNGIIDKIQIPEIFENLRNKIDQRFHHHKKPNAPNILTHLDRVITLMKMTTDTRLFRTWRSNLTDSKTKYRPQREYSICWSNILDRMESIENRELCDIVEHDVSEYISFLSKFEQHLSNCGINDHIFEEVIVNLVIDEYSVDAKINDWILRNLIQKNFKRTISNSRSHIITHLSEIYNFVLKKKSEFESNGQE